MTNKQIEQLTDPLDLAAAKHANYHWLPGGADDHKWNFSYTDFKDGAEWQKKQSKEKNNTSWPSVDTTNSDNVKAVSNRSKEFQKIIDNRMQSTPTPIQESFTREQMIGFAEWMAKHDITEQRIADNKWSIDDSSEYPYGATTEQLLTKFISGKGE